MTVRWIKSFPWGKRALMPQLPISISRVQIRSHRESRPLASRRPFSGPVEIHRIFHPALDASRPRRWERVFVPPQAIVKWEESGGSPAWMSRDFSIIPRVCGPAEQGLIGSRGGTEYAKWNYRRPTMSEVAVSRTESNRSFSN